MSVSILWGKCDIRSFFVEHSHMTRRIPEGIFRLCAIRDRRGGMDRREPPCLSGITIRAIDPSRSGILALPFVALATTFVAMKTQLHPIALLMPKPANIQGLAEKAPATAIYGSHALKGAANSLNHRVYS